MERERKDCEERQTRDPGKGLVRRLLQGPPRALAFCEREKAETENRE